MKRLTIILLFLLLAGTLLGAKSGSINRSVAVIPFFNSTQQAEYNYLSSTISDSLNAALVDTGSFELVPLGEIDRAMASGKGGFIWEETANRLGEELKADVILFGFYTISNDKITIYCNTLDSITRRSAININCTGNAGVQLMSVVKGMSEDLAEEMAIKLPPFKSNDLRYRFNFKRMATGFLVSSLSSATAGGIGLGLSLFYYIDIPLKTVITGSSIYYGDHTFTNTSLASTRVGLIVGIVASSIILAGSIGLGVCVPIFFYKSKKQKELDISLFIDAMGSDARIGLALRL
jgi:TolB-like protein